VHQTPRAYPLGGPASRALIRSDPLNKYLIALATFRPMAYNLYIENLRTPVNIRRIATAEDTHGTPSSQQPPRTIYPVV
ncbi:hypothetical protein, partial [Marinobacter sp. ELB17]|uniref:hypothetical protein n=1 Tax=Marinobacter sp. ELB17 TaxID=270374 RepID=UPI001D0D4F73